MGNIQPLSSLNWHALAASYRAEDAKLSQISFSILAAEPLAAAARM